LAERAAVLLALFFVATPRTRGGGELKFRKKPVVIDAIRTNRRKVIHTLEGDLIAEPGDWIITGIQGEKYPVKPDIFEATYEPCEESKEE